MAMVYAILSIGAIASLGNFILQFKWYLDYKRSKK